MAIVHRLKQNFTSGEISPLMEDRTDFERYKNGCKVLRNMVVRTQGPCSRRSGFQFIYDLNSLGLDVNNPKVRMVKFIFNELQSYVLTFFENTDGKVRCVFATGEGLVVGTGEVYPYDIEQDDVYSGVGEYYVDYPPEAAINELTVSHEADDGDVTDLVVDTDYTVVYLDGLATINVTNATIADGTLTSVLNVSNVATPVGSIVYIDMPDGFDIDKFDYAQSGDYLYMAQGSLPVHALVRSANDSWAVVKITFTSQPKDWSDDLGWPETITFFQQRLALGGNALRRQTIWLSQAGDYHNFGRNSPLRDSDALTFTLDSGTQNKIMWLQAVKSLHAGTLGNEWTVSGGSSNAVTPSNILSLRQTNNGSERIKPLMVGLTTLFVERFARVINEFIYDYQYESFKTSDMTILAPHFTEHATIIAWDYQQTPDSIIWVIMDDGTLKGLTYQRQHKVVGWHRHDTDGKFKTLAVIPGDQREDDLWTVVERMVNGFPRYYVEKKSIQFKSEEAIDGRFLDSFLVYDGPATETISGLGHLEGQNISILADGAVVPLQFVVLGGNIQLPAPASHVVAGLPYTSEVRPNLPEIPMADGTSLMRVQSITKINISLYRSLGMWIGVDNSEDGEREEEQPFRKPTDLTGQALPLVTGIYEMNFMEAYDNKSEYFIRQKDPLPLTITGIVDEVVLEDE